MKIVVYTAKLIMLKQFKFNNRCIKPALFFSFFVDNSGNKKN